MNFSNALSYPPRLFTEISSSQNSSRYLNVSENLEGEDYEMLNSLEEMF